MNMNCEKDISIITPIYNTPIKYLEKYLQSFDKITDILYEIILVNDGSKNTDTIEWLNNISRNNHVIIINSQLNQGISISRNIALDKANGKYIAILDSDDYYEKNYLIDMYETAEKYGSEMVLSGYSWVNENEELIKEFRYNGGKEEYRNYIVPCSSRLIKRSLIEDYHIRYPEKCLLEDPVFNIFCISRAKNIRYIDIVGFCNREHKKRFSHNKNRFSSIPKQKIPLDYIKNMVEKANSTSINRNRAFNGEILNLIASITCVFCRNTNSVEYKNIVNDCTKIIIENLNRYLSDSFMYLLFGKSDMKIRIIQFGLAFSILLKQQYIYSKLVSKIINISNKEKKNEYKFRFNER